jgi:septal ring factor EnvC (AmiA/AmiB activator)
MQGDIKQMQGDITQTQGDISTLQGGQAKMEQEIADIRHIVIKIENQHGRKLDALIDGYSALYDISGEIRMDVAYLKNIQEKHDLRIKWLGSAKP